MFGWFRSKRHDGWLYAQALYRVTSCYAPLTIASSKAELGDFGTVDETTGSFERMGNIRRIPDLSNRLQAEVDDLFDDPEEVEEGQRIYTHSAGKGAGASNKLDISGCALY